MIPTICLSQRHTRSSDAEHAEQRAKQQALVREWQQAHFTDCAHDDSETVPLARDELETANGRASGSEVTAAHTVAGAAAAGAFRPSTATLPLPVQFSRPPHQSGPSTGEGEQAIAPTPTVADQPHWPPAPVLDEVYALEVATSEAAALVPGAGTRPPWPALMRTHRRQPMALWAQCADDSSPTFFLQALQESISDLLATVLPPHQSLASKLNLPSSLPQMGVGKCHKEAVCGEKICSTAGGCPFWQRVPLVAPMHVC